MAELKIISMDEVQSKEVNWLWYPYCPLPAKIDRKKVKKTE